MCLRETAAAEGRWWKSQEHRRAWGRGIGSWVLHPKGFCLPKAGILGEVSEDPIQRSSASHVGPFRVMVSTDGLALVIGAGTDVSLGTVFTWVGCFSGPRAERQLRPRCYLWYDETLSLWSTDSSLCS